MYNEIHIGPITIYGYGLMCAIGLLSGYTIAEKRAKKYGLDTDLLLNLFFACMIGCAVGAKLLFCIVEYKEFLSNPALLFDFDNNSSVSFNKNLFLISTFVLFPTVSSTTTATKSWVEIGKLVFKLSFGSPKKNPQE